MAKITVQKWKRENKINNIQDTVWVRTDMLSMCFCNVEENTNCMLSI